MVQVGESVYVAGNPRGLEGTISEGIISAIRPEGDILVDAKVLQITAAISPGSSGGPVLSGKGKVIGVSVASFRGGQNLNFAIPSNYLTELITQVGDAKPSNLTDLGGQMDIKELGLTIIELLAILVISTIPLVLIIIAMPSSRGRSGVLRFLSCRGLIIISLIMMVVT